MKKIESNNLPHSIHLLYSLPNINFTNHQALKYYYANYIRVNLSKLEEKTSLLKHIRNNISWRIK